MAATQVPKTPSELSKLASHVDVDTSVRLQVGCALLVASRIESLEGTLSRVLDVLLKHADARAALVGIGAAIHHLTEQVANLQER